MAKKKYLTIAMSLALSVSLLLGIAVNAMATGDETAASLTDEIVEVAAEGNGDTPEEYSSADIVGEDDVDTDDESGDDAADMAGNDTAGDAGNDVANVEADDSNSVEENPAPEGDRESDGADEDSDPDADDPVADDTDPDAEPDEPSEDENPEDDTEEPAEDDGQDDIDVLDNGSEAESQPVRAVNPAGGNVSFGDPVSSEGVVEVKALEPDMARDIRFTFTIDNEAIITNGVDQLVAVNINPQQAFSEAFPKLENVQFTLRTAQADDLLTISYDALQDGIYVDKDPADPYWLDFTFDDINTSKYNETQTIANVYLKFLNGQTPNGTKGELYVKNIYFEVTDSEGVTTGYEYEYIYDAAGEDAPKLEVTAKGSTSWTYGKVLLNAAKINEANSNNTIEVPANTNDTGGRLLGDLDDPEYLGPIIFTAELASNASGNGIEPTDKVHYAARLEVPAGVFIKREDIKLSAMTGEEPTGISEGVIYGMRPESDDPDAADVMTKLEMGDDHLITNETVTVVWETDEAIPEGATLSGSIHILQVYLSEDGESPDEFTQSQTISNKPLRVHVGGANAYADPAWSRSYGEDSGNYKDIAGTITRTATIKKDPAAKQENTKPELQAVSPVLEARGPWVYPDAPNNQNNYFGAYGGSPSKTRDAVYYNQILGDPMYYAYWVDIKNIGIPATTTVSGGTTKNAYWLDEKLHYVLMDKLTYTVHSTDSTNHGIYPLGFTPGAYTIPDTQPNNVGKAISQLENFTVKATYFGGALSGQTFEFKFKPNGELEELETPMSDVTDAGFGYDTATNTYYLLDTADCDYVELEWRFVDVDATMKVAEGGTPSVLFGITDDTSYPKTSDGKTTVIGDDVDDTTVGITGRFSLNQRLTTHMESSAPADPENPGDGTIAELKEPVHYKGTNYVKWVLQTVDKGPKKSGTTFDENGNPINRTLKNGDIVEFELDYTAGTSWLNLFFLDKSEFFDVAGLKEIEVKLYLNEKYPLDTNARSAIVDPYGNTITHGTVQEDKDGKYVIYKIEESPGFTIYKKGFDLDNASPAAVKAAYRQAFGDVTWTATGAGDRAITYDGWGLYFRGTEHTSAIYEGDRMVISYKMTVAGYNNVDDVLAKQGITPNNNAYSKAWNKGPYPPPWVDEGGWKAPVRGQIEAAVELTLSETGRLAPYVPNSATLFGALIKDNVDEKETAQGPVLVFDLFGYSWNNNNNYNSNYTRFDDLTNAEIAAINAVNAHDTDPGQNPLSEENKLLYEAVVARYVTGVQSYQLADGWKSSTTAGQRANAAVANTLKDNYVHGKDYTVRFYSTYGAVSPATAASVRYVVIAFTPSLEMKSGTAVQATVGNWSYQYATENGGNTSTVSRLYFAPSNDMFTPVSVHSSYGKDTGRGSIQELTLLKAGAARFVGASYRELGKNDKDFPYVYAEATAQFHARRYQIQSSAKAIENLSAKAAVDTAGDTKFYEGDILQHVYTVTNSSSQYAPEPYVLRGFSAILPEGQVVYRGDDYELSVKVSGTTLDPSEYSVDVLDYEAKDDKRQLVITWNDNDDITLPATTGKNTAVLTFQSMVEKVEESTWLAVPVKTQYAGYFDKLERTVPMNGHPISEYDEVKEPQWFSIKGIKDNTGFHRLGAEALGYTYTDHISPGVEITIEDGAKKNANTGKYEMALAINSVLWYSVEIENPLKTGNGHHQVNIDDYLLVVVLPAGVEYQFASDQASGKAPQGSLSPVAVNGAEYFENGFGEQVLVWRGDSLDVNGTWKVYLRTVLEGTHVGDLNARAYLIPYDQYFGDGDIAGNRGTREIYDYLAGTHSYHLIGGESNSLLDGRANDVNLRLQAGRTPMMTSAVTVDVINPVGASGYLTVKEVDTSNATSNGIIEVNRGSDLLFTSELRNSSSGTTYKDITMIEELPSEAWNLSGWEPTLLLDEPYELKVAGSKIDKEKYQVYLLPDEWSVDSKDGNWILWKNWAQYAEDEEDYANPTAIKVVFKDIDNNEITLANSQSAFFSWYMHVEEFEELDKFNLNAYARTRFDFNTDKSGGFKLRSSTVGVRLMYMDGAEMTVTKEIGGSIQPGTFWFRLERWITGVDYDDSFRVTTENVETADDETGWFSITVPEDATEASVTIEGLEEGKYRIVEELEQHMVASTNVVYSVQYAIDPGDPDDSGDPDDPGTGDPGAGDPGAGDPGAGDPGDGDTGDGDPGDGDPDDGNGSGVGPRPGYSFTATDEINLYKGRETLAGVMNTSKAAVIYHAGEGTGDDVIRYVVKEKHHTILSNDEDTKYIPPYGYEFYAWSPDPAGSTVIYNPGYQLFIAADVDVVHLTALYRHDGKTYYTLTYHPNGGVGGGSEKIIPGKSTIIAQAADYEVSREGYSFLGWSAQKTGGANPTYAPGETLKLERDMTLYAIWKKDDNGGGGSSSSQPDASSDPTSETPSKSSSEPSSKPSSGTGSEPASEPASNPETGSTPDGTGGSSSNAGSGIDEGSTTSRSGGIASGTNSQPDGGGDASAPSTVSSAVIVGSSSAASAGSSSTRDENAGGPAGGGGGTDADPGAGGGGGTDDGTGAGGDGTGGDGDGGDGIALGDYDPNNTVDLFGNELPLGGLNVTNAWSLLNLVISVIALLCSVVGGVSILRNREGKRRAGGFKTGGTIVGVVPIILFLILENLRAEMVLVTKWTPLIIAVFVVQLLLVVLAWVRTRQDQKQNEDDDQPPAETPIQA